jgi:hypothetical protein
MKATLGLALVFLLCIPVFADDSDDTLRYYLGKSDLDVLGEISSDPEGVLKQAVVVRYNCDFKIKEVLKGKKPGKETIPVTIRRFELDKEDELPVYEKGTKCILFLKDVEGGKTPVWHTSDFWFGFQRPSPWMARSLKRLAQEEAKDKP